MARASRRSAPVRALGEGRQFASLDDPALAEFFRVGSYSSSGASVTPDSAMRVAAVFTCVRLISGAVATMPLHLRRRVDDRRREDASDHWLWGLLRRRPNPWQTPSQFRRQLQTQLLLRGNGRAMKVRSRGQVTALIPLNPDRTRVEQRDDWRLVYHYTRKDGRTVELQQEDVFDLTGMTLDGVNGLSVIGYAREAIGLSLTMERHGASTFRNGTHMGSVLKHPGQLGLEGQTRLRASMEAFRGAENAGKTLILEEGMEFIPLGMTFDDAQFIEGRGFQRSDIFMFFGVPPHMAGDTTKTTSWGSGIEQQSLGFVAYTLEDWLTTWEESINRDLIPEGEPNVFAWFNRAGLVKGDIKSRYAAYAVARQWGWMNNNDIRALENMNPIEEPYGNDYAAGGNAQAGRSAAADDEPREGEERDDG